MEGLNPARIRRDRKSENYDDTLKKEYDNLNEKIAALGIKVPDSLVHLYKERANQREAARSRMEQISDKVEAQVLEQLRGIVESNGLKVSRIFLEAMSVDIRGKLLAQNPGSDPRQVTQADQNFNSEMTAWYKGEFTTLFDSKLLNDAVFSSVAKLMSSLDRQYGVDVGGEGMYTQLAYNLVKQAAGREVNLAEILIGAACPILVSK